MSGVAELVSAIVGAGKAVASARGALQRSRVATARTAVMRDNVAAEMKRAAAMLAAAADRPGVLARDSMFAVDVEILTARMLSINSALADYESAPFLQRFLFGDVPEEFLSQHNEWIQEFLQKWQANIDELMAMSPDDVDAEDFARARAIFARPLLLLENAAVKHEVSFTRQEPVHNKKLLESAAPQENTNVRRESSILQDLREALEDMQVSVVTGKLYKRGTSQKHVLQDTAFSLATHRFKTRKHNMGRDKVVAKLSTLSKKLDSNLANWEADIDEFRALLNSLLPKDLPIGEDWDEDAEDTAVTLHVRVLPAPSGDFIKPKVNHCGLPRCWLTM